MASAELVALGLDMGRIGQFHSLDFEHPALKQGPDFRLVGVGQEKVALESPKDRRQALKVLRLEVVAVFGVTHTRSCIQWGCGSRRLRPCFLRAIF